MRPVVASSSVAVRRMPLGRWRIIAALLVAAVSLQGCGFALRMGYGQGPSLAFRWLDGYVDFDDAQSLRVRTGLDEFFVWHRRTQLGDYADLLARAQAEIGADTTPERMCAWTQQFRTRVETALERALPTLADVMVTMSPQQIGNVEKKYAERNDEYRGDYLQKDPAKRRKAAVEREVDRAQTLYGRLDPAQKERVARSVDMSPYDAEVTYAERLHRQQDVIAMLKRLNQNASTRGDGEAAVRAFVQRLERSPREDYRAYSQRIVDYNCAFAAQLHNSTSPEQRRQAARKLKGWEDDLRALATDGAG